MSSVAQTTLPLDYAARALAVLISTRYFNSLLNTRRAASHFLGHPVSEDNTLFFPALGSRNGTIGLSILLLSLRGDRRAAGVIYSCCTFIGFSDLYVCWKWQGNWKLHLFGMVLLGGNGGGVVEGELRPGTAVLADAGVDGVSAFV